MPGEAETDNPIIRMFTWWNHAYRDGGFNAQAFARFFSKDAPFIVNGDLRGEGPEQISAHFQRILEATDSVELILPVKATLASPQIGFVHYQTKARVAGQEQTEDCLAVAYFGDGKIISFEVLGRPE